VKKSDIVGLKMQTVMPKCFLAEVAILGTLLRVYTRVLHNVPVPICRKMNRSLQQATASFSQSSTMVTTRRSLHIKSGDAVDPRRANKRHKQWVDIVTGILPNGPGVEACFDLLRSLFQVSMQGYWYWYRLLPILLGSTE
jgi:hypothetical protein